MDQWLQSRGLSDRARLAESLQVDAGFERAVETVLGDYLEAVCADELDPLVDSLVAVDRGSLVLIESHSVAQGASVASGAEWLQSHVRGPAVLLEWLHGVRVVDSLTAALAARGTLAAGESLITRSGEWVGRHWLRIARGDDGHSGVIEREQRLKELRDDLVLKESEVAQSEGKLQECRAALHEAERTRDEVQAQIQAAHRSHADVLGQLEASRARVQESVARRQRLDVEAQEVQREMAQADEALARARGELERGREALAQLDGQRGELEAAREELRELLTAARAAAQSAQLVARDLMVRAEGRRTALGSMQTSLARAGEQRTQVTDKVASLESELAGGDAPIVELEQSLADMLTRRLEVESELSQARRALEQADAELQSLDARRLTAEQRVTSAREASEQARLAAQETRVRREAIAEQFAATQFELDAVLASLVAEASVADWESQLVATRGDIEKLGQVNLAAIDELAENTERKEYLDRQFADLTSALSTLEEAMRKIDQETRTRFEDTFNRINAGLQEKFPRLFGGGHAYLELVGDDPLEAGVSVMARPPGKRNVTISQLSGGEKALTAVALVFSIFELNPAPFCLLDEVDAPLDENNVGRFCDIVREMAHRVQFIFITHNKATMELASQLLGVTMNEPGVSRLVAVDVDEAVRLAAS
jgi:chromosome segregation protein